MLPPRTRLFVCLALGVAAACGGADHPERESGALDHAFGRRGMVTTAFGDYAMLVALDEAPDGRIVAAGTTVEGWTERFGVARYRADGRRDDGFGIRGVVETEVARETVAVDVQARADGTTVVLGWSRDDDRSTRLTLARYDEHGRLDATFGTAGIAIDERPDVDFVPTRLLRTTNDTILVAGLSDGDSRHGIFVVRYTSDGRLDTSFGTGGTAFAETAYYGDAVVAVSSPDGAVRAAGLFIREGTLQAELTFVRFTPDGTRDPAFGTDGRVLVQRDDLPDVLGVDAAGGWLIGLGRIQARASSATAPTARPTRRSSRPCFPAGRRR